MSATTVRRLATAGSLSLALALAVPAAAFAGPAEQDGRRSGGQEQAQDDKGKDDKGKDADQAQQAGSSRNDSTSKGSGSGSSSSPARKGKRTTPKDRAGQGRPAGGDPRGNNGAVKLDGLAFDGTPGNEPHVGCTFQVDFFGFDAGDTALVTLTGHAPTGGGELYSKRHTISTDAAGGGQDVDESITFTAAQLGLFSITPHPKQGWHVKLAADVDSVPGGAKQKVFWVKCAAPAVAGTTPVQATGGGGGTAVTTGTTTATGAAPATTVVSTRSIERGVEATYGSGTATLTGTTTQAAQGSATGQVRTQGAARPSVLPFTGSEGLAYLLALGLSAVGVGTLAHRLGRRRAVAGPLS